MLFCRRYLVVNFNAIANVIKMSLKYKINDQISNNSILHDINDITEQFCHTPDGLLVNN